MTDATKELKRSLNKQRQEVIRLFAMKLHPTATSILDEGIKVIVSGGGGALTMRAVAKKANIKLASLQYHFKTFDHLISTLFTREFGFIADILWNTLEAVDANMEAPAEALRTAAETFMPPEGSANQEHRIYFHLLAFCSYDSDAFNKAKSFYKYYNTLMGYLISKVNPSLSAEECLARATLITSTLEGTGLYTILRAGGPTAEHVVHREIGNLAVHYAALPAMPKGSSVS